MAGPSIHAAGPAPGLHGDPPAAPRERLEGILRDLGSAAIGFSGGADSALLVKMAAMVLGDNALAVTAISASFPERDRRAAAALAREIGVRHIEIESRELENPSYIANAPSRCFFCKQELFVLLRRAAEQHGLAAFAYGAITDDLGDFRPGMDAARRAGARAPLLEAGFGKPQVRELSRLLGLSTWDRPASACLSSRIPHGTAIEASALRRVELAEDFLIAAGLASVRVRAHGEIARIEVLPGDLPRCTEPAFREALTSKLRELGFRYVALDLDGYRPGSLNPAGETASPDLPGESSGRLSGPP
ncbi:MAG TPA: ATP-dependent sacrificial sulfur transferase LarE [Candidatus Polarisedimenticolia bacterium]|nr:ATP-dependent sacrificial sulfur transferase LarE [Candidatus Polarisedimenticolia bacterium]